MKIPSKFTLGAVEWTVKSVEDLGDRTGQCDYSKALILLEKNPNKQVFAQTFCHELMHAFMYSSGKLDDHDEVLVENLASSLHQFMQVYED